ncbi:Tfp pilus assembly protein PilO [Desulfohalotomaculum tongense]|uniref:type 4a pilus biogenesis protein PilO n=1 Tax=Desulforadius tongensis TaxID=1216062 RepID=UPI0019590033|nr:type 4a pilus biogenesis protein PilO [Desulforadius tongensis]MBM7854510.1 Tfp pilus assembly protein PilO [Desulforadius tongensis]
MSKLTIRERVLLLILLGLVISCLIYICLLGPQIREYLALSQEIKDTAQKLEQAKTASGKLVLEKKAVGITKISLEEMKKMFTREIRDGKLFIKLDTEAKNRNVVITEIITGEMTERQYYLEQPLDITVLGDYRNVLSYIQWLENTAQWANYSEIKQFIIEPDQDDTGEKNVIVKSNLTLVFYSDPSPRGKLQVQHAPEDSIGRRNVFLVPAQYHFLHNND